MSSVALRARVLSEAVGVEMVSRARLPGTGGHRHRGEHERGVGTRQDGLPRYRSTRSIYFLFYKTVLGTPRPVLAYGRRPPVRRPGRAVVRHIRAADAAVTSTRARLLAGPRPLRPARDDAGHVAIARGVRGRRRWRHTRCKRSFQDRCFACLDEHRDDALRGPSRFHEL